MFYNRNNHLTLVFCWVRCHPRAEAFGFCLTQQNTRVRWLFLKHKDMHQSQILSKWLWKWPITHLEHVSKYLNELWNSINFAIWLLFIKKNEICSFPCSLWLNGWNFNSFTLWNCCKAVAFSAWRSFEHVPALGKRKCRKKLKEYWQKYSRKRKQFFTKPTLT